MVTSKTSCKVNGNRRYTEKIRRPKIATIRAPENAAAVPKIETPPEVPFETFLKLKIEWGADFERTPTSVAQVSAVAAAKEIKKSKMKMDA